MNLPNQLTVLRIIMIPIFILVLVLPIDLGTMTVGTTQLENTHLIAAILFAAASITDWLDGKIARSRGLVTNFGKFADPLADKMLFNDRFAYRSNHVVSMFDLHDLFRGRLFHKKYECF